MDGRTLIQRVEGLMRPDFQPMEVNVSDEFSAVVAPFAWEDASIRVSAAAGEPDWGAVRLWFLEWFQPRAGPLAPELAGVVHALDGPSRRGQSWQLYVDFGSAPVEAVIGLLLALASCGAATAMIGEIGGD